HRDLKPANIMVGAFGEVQVMDWGFAKQCHERPAMNDDSGHAHLSLNDRASLSGAIMGTPAYMHPEQARGQANLIDSRVDVFALGAILCEILTGLAPYGTGNADETYAKAVKGDLHEAHERLNACDADE